MKEGVKMYVLPYSTKEAFKFTPKGELLNKKKELEKELALKGLDRNPNKIVRLRKEVSDLTEKVYGKPEKEKPEGKLQEELGKAKEEKKKEQEQKIKERRESPGFLRIKIKKTEKGKLEKLQGELEKEEAQKGDNRNPKKIERLQKEVKEVEEKVEESEVEGSVATGSHVTLINKAIRDHDIMAVIEFSANYDNVTKEPEGSVDFKYKKYMTKFSGSRGGRSKKGPWEKTVKYTSEHDLTPEGKFEGAFMSSLLLDGKPVSPKDKFKVALDDFVKENMESEGLLPYGRSAKEGEKGQVRFPSQYKNTELDKTYYGFDHFFTAYDGLFTADEPYKKRLKKQEKSEKQQAIGVSTESEIKETIETLEKELLIAPSGEESIIRNEIKKLKSALEKLKKFDAVEEAIEVIDNSRVWFLGKIKKKLERVTEEIRVEKGIPRDKRDEKKIHFLEKRKRKLERRVNNMEDEIKKLEDMKKKKAFLIPIAGVMRRLYAVSKEWKELTNQLQKAEDELKHLEVQYKDVKEKDYAGLIEKKKKDLTDDQLKKLERFLKLKKEKEKKPEETALQEEIIELTSGEKGKEFKDIAELMEMKEKSETRKEKMKGKEKYKDYPELIESMREKKKKEIEELKKKLEQTEGKPGAFPDTSNEAVKDLYEIFSNAGVKRLPKMTLYGWLSPTQTLQIAKHLQAILRAKYEKKIDDLKSQKEKSKEKQEEEIKNLKKEHVQELGKARESIKALPADLKKRRDEFKKLYPSDYSRLKEPGWVDSSGKVSEILGKVDNELSQVKEKEKEERRPAVYLLEKGKWKELGTFLATNQKGLGIIAGKFSKAPLEAAPMPKDLQSTITTYLEKTQSDYNRAKKILDGVNKEALKDEDNKAEIERAQGEFSGAEKALTGAKNILTHFETMAKHVPALSAAEALLSNLTYFSGLYNYYSSVLWFGEKEVRRVREEIKEAAELTKDEIDELGKIKDKAVSFLEKLASTPLYEKTKIQRDVSKAKKELKDFIDGYDNYSIPKEHMRQPAKKQLERKYSSLPYEIVTALKPMTPEEREVKKKEMYFPGDLKKEIDDFIKKIEKKDPDAAEEARASLKQVEKEVKETYKNSLGQGILDKLFKEISSDKGDLSDKDFEELKKRFKDEATFILRQVVEKVNRRRINDFIDSMNTFVKGERPRKKDTPYLTMKSPEKYEEMWEYVDKHLPGLSKEPPAKDISKFTEGKPTPPAIRKYFEETFKEKKLPVSEKTLEQMNQIFQKEIRTKPETAGAGARSKGRAKPVKINPPKGTFEVEKEWLANKIERKRSGEEVILDVLGEAITKLKKEKFKGNFYIGSVVSGMVALLKEVINKMKILKVDTPKLDVPPKGPLTEKDIKEKETGRGKPSEFSGRADLTIMSDKDAEEIQDKMVDMIETVNDFIGPEEFNIPDLKYVHPEKGQKRAPTFLPPGLVNYFRKSARALAFDLAQKFVFSDIQSVDKLTEEDIIDIT